MKEEWAVKAVLYEALSSAFLYPSETVVELLASGGFSDVLGTSARALGLSESKHAYGFDALRVYGEPDALHRLRVEHTRLFVGVPHAVVSPYAGIWYARDVGVDPLLFVNEESMAVERFMASCGVARPSGTNEPLDHIGAELEFLQYLCLDRAGAIEEDGRMPVPVEAYEKFYTERFSAWSRRFARRVLEETSEPAFVCAANVMASLPEQPL